MPKKFLLSLMLLTIAPLLVLAQPGQAQPGQAAYEEGKNYDLIAPALRTD